MLCLIEFESVMNLHMLILSSYLSASSCGISLWARDDVKLIGVTHQSADDISVFYLKKLLWKLCLLRNAMAYLL